MPFYVCKEVGKLKKRQQKPSCHCSEAAFIVNGRKQIDDSPKKTKTINSILLAIPFKTPKRNKSLLVIVRMKAKKRCLRCMLF